MKKYFHFVNEVKFEMKKFSRLKTLSHGTWPVSILQIVSLWNTVPTHNSDTPNSDIYQNSDTLFALTKMSLFWEEEFQNARKWNFCW